MIEVLADDKAIARATLLLEGVPSGIGKALYHAANRSAMAGRTTAKRSAAKLYTVPPNVVLKTMKIYRGSKANPVAVLHSRSSRLPLTAYYHRPKTDTTGTKRKPVTVSVRKGVKSTIYGFVYNGNIYTRVGAKSLPVKRLYSLSVPQILENDKVREGIEDSIKEAFETRLSHEVNRLLAGYDAPPAFEK